MKLEARQIAILRHPKTREIVGKLYLWETGEIDPMWITQEVPSAMAESLPGESSKWAEWTLGRATEQDD